MADLMLNLFAIEVMQNRIEHGFITSKENMLEKLMLVVTEVAEAVEDVRHENWSHFGEELADVVIRVLDLSATLGIDLEWEIKRKMETFAHAPAVVSNWYENVWLAWDNNHNLENLNPCWPAAYRRAVEISETNLPSVFRS